MTAVSDSRSFNESSRARQNADRITEKTITFDGGTTNAIGDFNGTGDPFTIFAITGEVRARVFAICTTVLAGASAVLEVGISGDTASILPQTTATEIDAGEIWHDATPDASVEPLETIKEKIIVNGSNIIGNVTTANITSGVIKFICIWNPLSLNGLVVPG